MLKLYLQFKINRTIMYMQCQSQDLQKPHKQQHGYPEPLDELRRQLQCIKESNPVFLSQDISIKEMLIIAKSLIKPFNSNPTSTAATQLFRSCIHIQLLVN